MESFNTFSNHPVIKKHGPKIALVCSILILLLFLISSGINLRAQEKTKAKNYANQPLEKINTRKRPSYKINDVISANLFGNPKPVKVVKNAPKTTLNLTLQGILSATDTKVARAIISSNKKKKGTLYAVGDEIKGAGASIKEIRSQEVILNRNGAIESLPIKKSESKGDNTVYTPINNEARTSTNRNPERNSSQDLSTNNKARKIRKPNFSGLDKALDKLDKS